MVSFNLPIILGEGYLWRASSTPGPKSIANKVVACGKRVPKMVSEFRFVFFQRKKIFKIDKILTKKIRIPIKIPQSHQEAKMKI